MSLDMLSRREREILAHILGGLTSEDIAGVCHISVKTVETHRSRINRKIGVGSPVDLLLLAVARGWLERRDGQAKITFPYERSLAQGYEAVTP